jgi:hypothetical protein
MSRHQGTALKTYDVMVIGSGFAGMAAALFAAKRGLSVVQTGATGGIDFSTGFIDLLAVHPIADLKVWEDPFAALSALRRDLPLHPYCRVSDDEISLALREFTSFLGEQGLCYRGREGKNTLALNSAGTLKPTYLLPCTLWNGVEAQGGEGENPHCRFSRTQGIERSADRRSAGRLAGTQSRADQFPGHERRTLPRTHGLEPGRSRAPGGAGQGRRSAGQRGAIRGLSGHPGHDRHLGRAAAHGGTARQEGVRNPHPAALHRRAQAAGGFRPGFAGSGRAHLHAEAGHEGCDVPRQAFISRPAADQRPWSFAPAAPFLPADVFSARA